MKLFNYLKLFGAFTDGYQLIMLDPEPTDRQKKKMLEEANNLLNAGWARRVAWLERREAETNEAVDMAKEKDDFFPKLVDGKLAMPLQYVQDYMARKIAALQNNTSIHNKADVKELKEIFDEYGVTLTPSFKGLVFDHVNWSARDKQKPKLLVHAKDAAGDDICIRFEAAGELCQKVMHAILTLDVKPGTVFDMSFEAVDPAIAKNANAGKKVAEEGKYVNHNLKFVVGNMMHTGHPPRGQKFVQKPTIEFMEALFRQTQMATEAQ